MAFTIDIATTLRTRIALALFLGLVADAAIACQTPPPKPATSPPQASVPPPSAGLTGTSWQLVKFQGGDGTTLTPDNRANYTIEFAAGGQLNARIDCNRGRATWTSSGSTQLQFGALALTRAACPPGSLHDHIVKQWGYIRSYVIRDGHLFLSLMADGGIYEFEPVTNTRP